ncbi:hypothetical protein LCGC14_1637870 [marine sediment metagenome]|uniref:Uncharacterized protein n=1 Tax=marine sediment metagenome TaxID=412755 RepID=A0A0F9IN12_9ZZZZ
MAFTELLAQTCTVVERTKVAGGGYGRSGYSEVLVPDVPCLMQADLRGREIKVGAEVKIAGFILYLDNRALTEQDQIEQDGQRYGVLQVQDAGGQGHHLEVLLERVRM